MGQIRSTHGAHSKDLGYKINRLKLNNYIVSHVTTKEQHIILVQVKKQQILSRINQKVL